MILTRVSPIFSGRAEGRKFDEACTGAFGFFPSIPESVSINDVIVWTMYENNIVHIPGLA